MFDGTYAENTIAPRQDRPTDETLPGETREEAHRRQIKEWTEYLSKLPGKRGQRLRIALTHGWW